MGTVIAPINLAFRGQWPVREFREGWWRDERTCVNHESQRGLSVRTIP